MHDPDRRTGAHDPELGLGPGEHQVGAEVARVHRDVRAAIGLAQHDRELGDARGGERAQQSRALPNHPGALLAGAGHKTGGVDDGHEREAEGIAEAHEARRLVRPLRVEHAAEVTGLVGHDPHRPSLDPGQRGDDVAGPAREQLEQRVAVDDAVERVADVVGAPRLGGHGGPGVAERGRQWSRKRRHLLGRGRQVAQELSDSERGGLLVGLHEVADAVAVMNTRPAQRRRIDLLAECVADDTGPGQEHRRILGHQDQVGERGRIRAAPGRRARDNGDLWNHAGQGDGLAEDPSVAGERRRTLLHPCAARLHEPDHGDPGARGRLEHPHNRLGVPLAQRATEEAAVLRVAGDRPSVDRARAADDTVAGGRPGSEPGRDHARADDLDAPGSQRASSRSSGLRRRVGSRASVALTNRRPGARARRCARRRRTSSRSRPAGRH